MYLIVLMKGNEQKTIKSFQSKEEALAFGEEYNNTLRKDMGTLACISQASEHKSIIFKTWI